MTKSINGSHKLIESRLVSDVRSNSEATPIPSRVLQKYLTDNEHPIFNFIEGTFDRIVKTIKPVYAITVDRIVKNITGILTSSWQFELPQEEIQKNMQNEKQFIRMSHYLVPRQQNSQPSSRQSISLRSSIRKSTIQQSDLYKQKYNRSIFMFIWGPLTTIILTHLISNHPFATDQIRNHNNVEQNSQVNVVAGGIIHLLSMGIISFVMFVLFKVLGVTAVHSLFQHITLASYVGLATIIFSIICSTGINFLILPFGLVYILGCSYIHTNAYNQAAKPQLFELIGIGLLILFFYVCTGYMFYHYYHETEQNVQLEGKNNHLVGQFYNQQHFLHQRSYIV